jgi:16S rRNA G966 N2-methylase RsmD
MKEYNLNNPSLFLFYDKDIPTNINSIYDNYPNTNLIKLSKDKIEHILQFESYPKLYLYNPSSKTFIEKYLNEHIGGRKNKRQNYNPNYKPVYFPEHNDEILIDEVGKYSISKPDKAKLITNLIYQNIHSHDIIVTEGMSSVGGDTLALSRTFKKVNAIELDKTRYEYLQHNMKLFNRKNIEYYNESYLEIFKKLKQDVVYLDPPWGGPEYKNLDKVKIKLGNVKLEDLCKEIIENKLCKLLALKLPYNYDIEEFKKYNIKTYDLQKILVLMIKIN